MSAMTETVQAVITEGTLKAVIAALAVSIVTPALHGCSSTSIQLTCMQHKYPMYVTHYIELQENDHVS